MIGKIDKTPQLDIFRVPLKQRVRKDHSLLQLAATINWDQISSGLAVHYSPDKGRKAIPVRKMAGLLILKYLHGASDNNILKLWLEDPAIQYFCGETWPREKPVVNRKDLVNFRKRIGVKGMGIIFYPELMIILDRMKQEGQSALHNSHSHWNILNFFRHLFFQEQAG
jgi:IS5 family transposase